MFLGCVIRHAWLLFDAGCHSELVSKKDLFIFIYLYLHFYIADWFCVRPFLVNMVFRLIDQSVSQLDGSIIKRDGLRLMKLVSHHSKELAEIVHLLNCPFKDQKNTSRC